MNFLFQTVGDMGRLGAREVVTWVILIALAEYFLLSKILGT